MIRDDAGYRSPGDPAMVRPERRSPVMVDAMRQPRPYDELTPRQQTLFNAQLAAWRAAIQLVHEQDAHMELQRGGLDNTMARKMHIIQVRERAEVWEAANRRWRYLRGN